MEISSFNTTHSSSSYSSYPHLVTLDTLLPGQQGVVRVVGVENLNLCKKLLSMGIVPGTTIKVLKIAPLGDPMKIEALGYKLSLRLSEAGSVQIQL